jgi:hypothetical protein
MPIEGEVWVWLRRLANSVVGKTSKPDRLDTAMRLGPRPISRLIARQAAAAHAAENARGANVAERL